MRKKKCFFYCFLFCIMSTIALVGLVFENTTSNITNPRHIDAIADAYVAFVHKNIWENGGWKSYDKFIDSEFRKIDATDSCKKAVLLKCATAFLEMDLKLEDYMSKGAMCDNYVLYCRDLLARMYEYGVDEKIRIEIFFSMMEKYKFFCLQRKTEGGIINRKKELALIGALGYLRVLFESNLQRIEREIFTLYLDGLSTTCQMEVKERFAKFYRTVEQEIKNIDDEDRKKNFRVSGRGSTY